MKLTIIGGGGFRVPQVLQAVSGWQGNGEDRSPITHVSLFDIDNSRLTAISHVYDQIKETLPAPPVVTWSADLREALTDADFVFSAMRVGGTAGRVCDERCALDLNIIGQETVGPGGYAYALRTIPEVLALSRLISQVAPNAWVINFTNPAGIITQTMQTVLGNRVVGICDTPIGLVKRVSWALEVNPNTVDFDYVGLNHLGWLRSIKKDALPESPELLGSALGSNAVLDQIEEARNVTFDWVRALGAIPNEYLFYYYFPREALARIKAETHTRGEFLHIQQHEFYEKALQDPTRALALWDEVHAKREATYMAESRPEHMREGRTETDIAAGGYQQVALDIMKAIALNQPATMILGVANHVEDNPGQPIVTGLAPKSIVEIPVLVDGKGIHPKNVAPVTEHMLGLMTTVKACEDDIILAATTGDKTAAWRGIAHHPLVDSIAIAKRLVEDYCKQNPEINAVFS